MVALLYPTYDLRVDAEALGYLDHLLGMLRRQIDLETMAHVEYLVHLRPVCTALLMDCPEERWHREQIVLYHTDIVTYEVQDLGLGTA